MLRKDRRAIQLECRFLVGLYPWLLCNDCIKPSCLRQFEVNSSTTRPGRIALLVRTWTTQRNEIGYIPLKKQGNPRFSIAQTQEPLAFFLSCTDHVYSDFTKAVTQVEKCVTDMKIIFTLLDEGRYGSL